MQDAERFQNSTFNFLDQNLMPLMEWIFTGMVISFWAFLWFFAVWDNAKAKTFFLMLKTDRKFSPVTIF